MTPETSTLVAMFLGGFGAGVLATVLVTVAVFRLLANAGGIDTEDDDDPEPRDVREVSGPMVRLRGGRDGRA